MTYPKLFEQMLPDLIITNLNMYAFHIDALKLVRNYSPNKKKWLIVNNICSYWKKIFYGALQG